MLTCVYVCVCVCLCVSVCVCVWGQLSIAMVLVTDLQRPHTLLEGRSPPEGGSTELARVLVREQAYLRRGRRRFRMLP